MNVLVRGFKTLLKKIEAAKCPQTKQKYQDELKRKMEISLEKAWSNDLLLQKKRLERRQKKREANLQKQLNAAIKRQKKLERERKIMDDKFKRLKKEQELKSRLMSEEELDANFSSIDIGEYPNEEFDNFLRRYDAHSKEKIRRKKN